MTIIHCPFVNQQSVINKIVKEGRNFCSEEKQLKCSCTLIRSKAHYEI
jgi:hypothetical protein